jgi:hypothetical protein
MEPKNTPAPPDRRSFAKTMKVGLMVCLAVILAVAITVGLAGNQSPPARAAVTAAMGLMVGVVVVLFRGMQKLAVDPRYQLSGKQLVLLLTLAGGAILLFFWSISL